MFDLGGITHFTGKNQFPVTWSAAEAALLTTKCYDPKYWDAYWTIEPCRFVMARLERKDDTLFGTPRLTEAWRQAVLTHPLAYLRHRAAFTWNFLTGSNLTLELYHADDLAATASEPDSRRSRLVLVHGVDRLLRLRVHAGAALLERLLRGGLVGWPARRRASGELPPQLVCGVGNRLRLRRLPASARPEPPDRQRAEQPNDPPERSTHERDRTAPAFDGDLM